MIKEFRGKRPKIATTAYISETACIIGDVEIGEYVSIWPGAVIRADLAKITIGAKSCIEDNCVVHAASDLFIGEGVIVGHGVVVHCLKIGNYSLIGSNSTLLDDADIGGYCVIGAGSVVKQGARIPEQSMVIGSPAEIRGSVSPQQTDRIKEGVILYVNLSRDYIESER